jgi:hypothetical protein
MENFYSFFVSFFTNFHRSHYFLTVFCNNSLVVAVYTLLFGVSADASTVAGRYTISGITVVALPPAVDVCDVPIVSAAVSNVLVVSSCCYCWCVC